MYINPKVLLGLLWLFVFPQISKSQNPSSSVPFTFTLSSAARTSAGVYKKDGTLVRTLWGGVNYGPGTHTVKWDGADDDGRFINGGSFDIRVLSNNVKYEWEGVIGNSSSSFTGDGVHRSFLPISDIAITGNTAFYATHYNELAPSQAKFMLADPQVKIAVSMRQGVGQTTEFVATDGSIVYWGGDKSGDPSFIWGAKVNDNSEIAFPSGTLHENYNSIDVVNSRLSGLAVQKSGNFLFASHVNLNEIHVLNKTTGALVKTISFNSPGVIKVDNNDNLWVISGTNVTKHVVNSDGSISSPVLTISGLQIPCAMAISPDNNTVAIVDGGASQQIKAFNTTTGSSSWVFGQTGGYAVDPTVTDDKFDFFGSYMAFQPDGSFWVGDKGNYRTQHYTSGRTFIDRIMYIPCFYNSYVDPNNPTRVFANHLEFKLDYSKPLAPNNGSWKLAKNYRYSIAQGQQLTNVVTLSNGRTYGFLSQLPIRTVQIVELMPNGPLRLTGNSGFGLDSEQFYPDGSIRQIYSFMGVPLEWRKTPLTGFDASNNPIWGTKTTLATTPPITNDDPRNSGIGGTLRAGEQTSSNIMVIFNAAVPSTDNDMKYHLGAVRVGDNKWLWKTARNTYKAYRGQFPSDGAFDIGNNVNQYGGSVAMAMDRSIFWGYHGEFWRNSQVNMWNQVYDDGLLVGQFGATQGPSAPAGMAGNAFSGSICKDANGNIYLFHNDESDHAGIHRWKVTGINTIAEQTIPVVLPSSFGGSTAQYFDGNDLDNFNVKLSRLDTAINLTAAPAGLDNTNFSVRWTGFVKPTISGTYTFYANTSKGVRLWIDDNLVIDKWYNNGLIENSSASINLEGQKGYSFKMEVNGGTASLSWSASTQPKMIIPSGSYIPGDLLNGNGYDLLQNLPFSQPLENNLYGWKRNAATEEVSKWSILTNFNKSDKRQSPDLNFYYAKDDNQNTVYTVTRNLGNNQSLNIWKLSGEINFNGNFGNEANGGQYFEVLDNNGKIISRFYTTISFDPGNPAVVWGNDKIIRKDDNNWIVWEIGRNLPIDITASNGKITFKYGYYDPVTADVFDPSANWQAPKTMRVYFRGFKYSRSFNIYTMKFATNGDVLPSVNTTPPVVTANDADNTLSAFHSLGNPEIFVSENDKGYMEYTGQIDVGDVDRPVGYWKFKIRAIPGRNESSIVESPAFKCSRFLPDPPALHADDYANVLNASSIFGNSEILVSENDGYYVAYTGQINVGNVARPAGYWKFKIRSVSGRSESVVAESPVFSAGSTVTPAAPTIYADDYTNYLSVTHLLGISEIVISQNDGAFGTYNGPGNLGDIDLRAGFWKFKIKAAPGRNESPVVSSPAFTAGTVITTPAAPSLQFDDNIDIIGALSPFGASEIVVSENGGSYMPYTGQKMVGNVVRPFGYWKFKIKATADRNESAVVPSPAFTIINSAPVSNSITPDTPVIAGDDQSDILTASSIFGNSEILVSENNGVFVSYYGQISVGNVARAAGYWKFKIKSVTGRNESTIAESPAFSIATVTTYTPSAPIVTGDDNTNSLVATHFLGTSEIVYSENGGAFTGYAGAGNVGNVNLPAGYYRFKVKAAPGRNESAIAGSPAFTIAGTVNSTPDAPLLSADDNADILSVSSSLGNSEILVSENNAVYTSYARQISVGNIARAAGYWKFKIKAATGRNESAIVQSPAFTVANTTPVAPVLSASDDTDVLNAASPLGTSEILVSENNNAYTAYSGQIGVGNVARAAGYWKFKIRAATGRNESAIVQSPAFTVANTTPASPVLSASDDTDVLSATSPLGTSEILVSENNNSYTAYTGPIGIGNVSRAAGYWKFKIRAATGRNESAIVQSPAFTVANTTPAAPVLSENDDTDVLSAASPLGTSEILVSENNNAYTAYVGPIIIGNVSRAAGYWKFKIRAATGRNESAIVQSPAFTVANTTPAAPVLSANDDTDVLSATSPLGTSEILVSENNNVYTAYFGQISVGNVSRAAGYWKFKIRAATGRNESAIVQSPAFTVANITPDAPVVKADDNANILSATSPLGTAEILVSINNGAFVPYTSSILVNNMTRPVGYWKFKIKSSAGRNESPVVLSPAFNAVVNTTPDPPTIFADDNTNALSATHALGISEIVYSDNGGPFTGYAGPGIVGNVSLPAGYYKFKIKAAPGRNESDVVGSPAFTIANSNTTPAAPVVTANDSDDVLSASSLLGLSEILVSENDGAFIAYTGQVNVGNVARPAGYWKFKVKAATGRNESVVVSSAAFSITNTTPASPVLVADNNANTLTATSSLGNSAILVSENGGGYTDYTGQINVGNVARPAGYWQFKIESAPGRNESAVVLSPAFTYTNITPAAPVLTADDVANTLTASSALGNSEILVSENDGAFAPYTNSIVVGNMSRPVGYWRFKIRAATGRNESPVVSSPAFTIPNITPAAPAISANDTTDVLSASSALGISEILVSENKGLYIAYTGQIKVGNVARDAGYWRFKIRPATGRNESFTVLSPAFTVSVVIPDAPVVSANDSTNTISAASTLGGAAVYVSENAGSYVLYTGPINVGNTSRPAGYWKFKVVSANGYESPVVSSPAFNTTPTPPAVTGDDNSNSLSATHALGISEIVVSENGGAYTPYAGPGIVGNVNLPAGYYRFKVRAATGRNESAVAVSPAFTVAVANTTPAAPVLSADDNSDILSASSALGISEILVSENGAAFIDYSGQIHVGNVVRPAGYWKFKIQAAPGRNESAVVQSPAFTVANWTPSPPVITADDNTNLLSVTHALGISEVVVSENGGAYTPYAGPGIVGNVSLPAGYYKFKIKPAPGRNESTIAQSPAFTVAIVNITPAAPALAADDNNDVLSASSALGISEILVSENGAAFTAYTGLINVGNVARPAGYWMFKIESAPGRNESAVVQSPAFTVANWTPSPPVISADDNANSLSATHSLGISEIVVSQNGGPFTAYAGPGVVGNVNLPAGYYKFKVKTAPGRNESTVASSPAFTAINFNSTPAAPVITANDYTNYLAASSPLGISEIVVSENNGPFNPYAGAGYAGNVDLRAGYWKFKIKAAPGRNESAVALSPAFTSAAVAKGTTGKHKPEEEDVFIQGMSIKILPNPVRSTGKIECTIDETGDYLLQLYAENGMLVKTIFSGNLSKGTSYFELDVTRLSGSIYTCRLASNRKVVNKQVVIAR